MSKNNQSTNHLDETDNVPGKDVPIPESLTDFIETKLDFSTSHYNEGYVKRRIDSRVRRTNIGSYEQYESLVKESETEQTNLLNSFSINVTGFFRNADVWTGIKCLLEKITKESNDEIRIWSAGCADGREPYSLSMLALDSEEIDSDRISILATDINEESLATARKGEYEQSPTENLDEQLEFLANHETYIEKSDNVLTMGDEVKSLIEFEHHDLINGNQKEGFDLVLCRNLFIYIGREYEDQVFTRIKNGIVNKGFLTIGKAETIPKKTMKSFNIVDTSLRIYQKK